MNYDPPFPPALPAVVPSPIGPAISYSNIRAVTSRAERTLDSLEKKISKRLAGQMNDSGMVGAVVESKVRQRLADQIAPAEQLYSDYTDLIQNQIAGNLAPAVATLEDLQGTDESTQRVVALTETAGHGMPGVEAAFPPVATPPMPSPSKRAVGIARRLQAAAGLVAGGSSVSPFVGCPPISPDLCDQIQAAATAAAGKTPPDVGSTPSQIPFFCIIRPDGGCCIDQAPFNDPTQFTPGTQILCTFSLLGTPSQRTAGVTAAYKTWGVTFAQCSPGGGGPPVDCKVHPLDPSCPPDCKTHPEDPRCPPTPPTCPPPCIEVTCPPPIINVPPCPSLTPTSCVQIDLCDYDKFCKFIKDCLIQAKEDCALDNDTAYTYKDCGGQFGSALKFYLGDNLSGVLTAPNVDQLIKQAASVAPDVSSEALDIGDPRVLVV